MNLQSATKKIKIGILGGNGLVGSDLVRFLGRNYKVDSITRENYNDKKGKNYRIFINANGNSKRYWANQNPLEDFFTSTVSVYQSIYDFPCDLYIYISSPDVYENHAEQDHTKEEAVINPKNLETYGLHNYLSELIIKAHKKNFLI